jgi:hypothetical protein
MTRRALFGGLVIDEDERPVKVVIIGWDAFYVVDDDGFQRHIQSEYVDRQVLEYIGELIEGHEGIIAEGTMKMLGQEDIFTKAMIENSLQNVEGQFDAIIDQGLPEEARAWLGMVGFQVVIDHHGDVISVVQPGQEGESYD